MCKYFAPPINGLVIKTRLEGVSPDVTLLFNRDDKVHTSKLNAKLVVNVSFNTYFH